MNKPTYANDGGVEDILKAKLTEDWEKLTEASINRIKGHVNDGHFGIVTSWRGGEKGISTATPEDRARYKTNRENFNKFRHQVRKDGFGFNRLIGYGTMEKGSTPSYKEHSVFISGKGQKGPLTKNHVHNYANLHNQDSYIYAGPETGGEVHVFDSKTGNKTLSFGKFSPGKLGDYHSRLVRGIDKIAYKKGRDMGDKTGSKKKSFALESVVWEFVPERTVSSMLLWEKTTEAVARELGIKLAPAMQRIEEKLQSQFYLFEDSMYLSETDLVEVIGDPVE